MKLYKTNAILKLSLKKFKENSKKKYLLVIDQTESMELESLQKWINDYNYIDSQFALISDTQEIHFQKLDDEFRQKVISQNFMKQVNLLDLVNKAHQMIKTDQLNQGNAHYQVILSSNRFHEIQDKLKDVFNDSITSYLRFDNSMTNLGMGVKFIHVNQVYQVSEFFHLQEQPITNVRIQLEDIHFVQRQIEFNDQKYRCIFWMQNTNYSDFIQFYQIRQNDQKSVFYDVYCNLMKREIPENLQGQFEEDFDDEYKDSVCPVNLGNINVSFKFQGNTFQFRVPVQMPFTAQN